MVSLLLAAAGAFVIGFVVTELVKGFTNPKVWDFPITINVWFGLGCAMLTAGLMMGV